MIRATLLFALLLAAGCDRGSASGAATPAAPTGKEPAKLTEVRLAPDAISVNHVEIGAVGKRVLVPTIPAPARIAFDAEAMSHVGAAVVGRVAELKVRLGEAVKKDDELVIVESPDLGEAQSDYLQKKTALAAAQAAIEPVRISYERGKSLFEQSQGLALAEVQKREAEFKAAQAAAQAAAAALNGAQNKLALMGMSQDAVRELEKTGKLTPRYSVRAPIAGQIIQFDLTPGALIGPDKDLQVEVADVGKVWVLADVAEADYAKLRKGAPARVTAAALAGKTFDGTVTLLAPALDPATRTLQARVEVKNPDGLLRPGMLARAEIESADANPQPVLAVPDDTIVTLEDEHVVFLPVEGDSGKFKKQEVQVGQTVGGWTQVESGLKEGEKIVVRGATIIRAQFNKPPEE